MILTVETEIEVELVVFVGSFLSLESFSVPAIMTRGMFALAGTNEYRMGSCCFAKLEHLSSSIAIIIGAGFLSLARKLAAGGESD